MIKPPFQPNDPNFQAHLHREWAKLLQDLANQRQEIATLKERLAAAGIP